MAETFHFECPAPLAARGILVRPETVPDIAALRRIYFEHRRAEFALLPLAQAQLAALVQSQFDMQRGHYATQYPQAQLLALVEGGEIIGRLYLAQAGGAVWIVDILLQANSRNQGIASLLLGGVLAQAARLKLAVCLHVDKHNRAARLYQRLGFAVTGESDMAWRMQAGETGCPASS